MELDGSQHYDDSEIVKDQIRTEKLEKRNLFVIRIPNNEVMRNFSGFCEYIDGIVTQRLLEHGINPYIQPIGLI